MPRYYLNLHNAHIDSPDEEGIEVSDLETARVHALRGIRDFLGHELKHGQLDLRGHVEIQNDIGEELLTVAFADAVTITMP